MLPLAARAGLNRASIGAETPKARDGNSRNRETRRQQERKNQDLLQENEIGPAGQNGSGKRRQLRRNEVRDEMNTAVKKKPHSRNSDPISGGGN
jgi:hypothetical protein